MNISSTEFENDGFIPAKYTCEGENISPPLIIDDIPERTKSMALIVDDPDAPGGTFTHCIVWNIPPETLEIPEGSVPQGAIEGINSSGRSGYTGPCPPSGVHHYQFTIFALSDILDLSQESNREGLLKAMAGLVIGQDTLIGLYVRK